jgi:hypothetical protein
LFERLGELVPGVRSTDGKTFAIDVGGAEIAIELEPAEGVIASAAMPVLDGLSLRVRPDGGAGNFLTGHRAFDHSFRVDADDPEIARLLLDEATQIELAAGRHTAQTVVVANRRVDVFGTPFNEAHQLCALRAAAALAARPYQIVRKLRRALRRWGPVPSGEAWDVTSFRLALTMPTPSVHLAWRQRTIMARDTTPRLQTRVVASRRGTAGTFTVIDAQRVTPPALGTPVPVPLDVPDVVRGRYLLLADRATDAHDDLAPHLPLLGGALPLAVLAEGDSVAVVFDGFEEQRIALEPALALARGLASTANIGPYR